MCLIINESQLPSTAEDDIVVFKVFHRATRSSMIHSFEYEIGKLYETTLEEGEMCAADQYVVDYLNKKDYRWPNSKELRSIGQGFHSCKTLNRATILGTGAYDIYTAIIPKGAQYYEDETELIVSDKIIIKGPYELSNSQG